MVSTLRTLQPQLPATGLDIAARSEKLGTIHSQRQRAGSNAGPIHRAPVGRPAIVPLLEYVQTQGWKVARSVRGGRVLGLCPWHVDHPPSFLVDPGRNLFYCYGCTRGGDVIRFAELYHQVKFPQAVVLLRPWRGVGPVLQEAVRFYRTQLNRHSEAFVYLYQRGIRSAALIEEMRIGYAP